MGRDSTGKHQEKGQLTGNQTQSTSDYASRDKSIGKYDASVDSLAANPGYSPQDLQAMRAEQGDQISAIHGNDATQLRQNAAETGNANDAGLYSQLRAVSDARSRDTAMGNNNIAGQQAQQVLETRRALPGFRFQPAQLYQSSASNLTNANTALINGRQQADQTTPLWAQMGMTAMSAAGQAASKGCWIAEALFGEFSWRTRLLRSWLNHEFADTLLGRLVMAGYLRFGQRVAAVARNSQVARAALRPLFNFALCRAIRARGV